MRPIIINAAFFTVLLPFLRATADYTGAKNWPGQRPAWTAFCPLKISRGFAVLRGNAQGADDENDANELFDVFENTVEFVERVVGDDELARAFLRMFDANLRTQFLGNILFEPADVGIAGLRR